MSISDDSEDFVMFHRYRYNIYFKIEKRRKKQEEKSWFTISKGFECFKICQNEYSSKKYSEFNHNNFNSITLVKLVSLI